MYLYWIKFMIKLKELITEVDSYWMSSVLGPTKIAIKGFVAPLTGKDVGKYVVVYKDENTLVKGTRLYNTEAEAQKIVDLVKDTNVVIKQIGFGQG